MGVISYIDLRTDYKSIYTKSFNPESHVVPGLYRSFLKDYIIPSSTQQINIIVSHDWVNSLTTPMNVKGFKEAHIDFDFENYISLDKYEKKLMQLEAIHQGMMKIAQKEGWKTKPLLDAYNNCLESKLEYQFNIGKPKFARNRQYKIGLWCNWDMDFVEVYWILYNKNNNEMHREVLTKRLSYEGNFAYFLNLKWLDNITFLVEDTYIYGKREKWKIEITPPISS